MIYIYRSRWSPSGEELAYSLTAFGIQARFIRAPRPLQAGDRLICWGHPYPEPIPEGVAVLNNVAPPSKLTELVTLQRAGVPAVIAQQNRPVVQPAGRPNYDATGIPEGASWDEAHVRQLIREMQAYLDRPLPPQVEWLARASDHMNGNDLLNQGPDSRHDFWVRKEPITREIRIHSWLNTSIRAGVKVPRRGEEPHPWIRSTNAGWTIQYGGFQSTPEQRALAHSAVAALGLQFGAVDIGITEDGRTIVLEVNRAPGLEGPVEINPYINAVARWLNPAETRRAA